MVHFGKVKTNYLYTFGGVDNKGVQMPASYGVGLISTGTTSPKKFQWSESGHIITEYHIDISGYGCKGDAANDVIGLAAGGAAYFDQYVEATHGIVYRAECICVEAPGEGTATITADIDIAGNTSAALAYDGAAGAAEIALGTHVKGGVFVDEACALTTTDYLYLVEGDTAATTGVYDAGQLIIRLFGHAVLTA